MSKPKSITNLDYLKGWLHCGLFVVVLFFAGGLIFFLTHPKPDWEKKAEFEQIAVLGQFYDMVRFPTQYGCDAKRIQEITRWVIEDCSVASGDIPDVAVRIWVSNIRSRSGGDHD